ncbi:hypothetical protein KCP71_15730 [Salmonella enterica subsp. enterica]|nr:hypothetical protein KCP71_15730 [Salmonella enterica subsp. enterica]
MSRTTNECQNSVSTISVRFAPTQTGNAQNFAPCANQRRHREWKAGVARSGDEPVITSPGLFSLSGKRCLGNARPSSQ